MSAEIIDQANELEELQREAAIARCRIDHNAVSAIHCVDCGEGIPERRREAVADGRRHRHFMPRCRCGKTALSVTLPQDFNHGRR